MEAIGGSETKMMGFYCSLNTSHALIRRICQEYLLHPIIFNEFTLCFLMISLGVWILSKYFHKMIGNEMFLD